MATRLKQRVYTLTLLYVLHRSKTIGADRVDNTASFGVSYPPPTTVGGGLERSGDEVSGGWVQARWGVDVERDG